MSEVERLERELKEMKENNEDLQKKLAEVKKQVREKTRIYLKNNEIDWNKVADAITASAKFGTAVISVATKCNVM